MSAPVLARSSEHRERNTLVARIKARRELLETMAHWASGDDLEQLANDEEEDLKSLAALPGDNLENIRAKAAPLADRELEEQITFGELALILSIISDLTRHSVSSAAE